MGLLGSDTSVWAGVVVRPSASVRRMCPILHCGGSSLPARREVEGPKQTYGTGYVYVGGA